MKKKYDYLIGVDPGVHTGIALWDVEKKNFKKVYTISIHLALEFVRFESCFDENRKIFVRVEDARKRKGYFGDRGAFNHQGVGSIKRDCKIWEDFLTDLGVDFEMIAPIKGGTKMKSDPFKKLTSWEGRTNSHSRDAALLIFGYK